MEYTPVVAGDFVGSTASGGPVNFFNIRVNPHGNGTHTECVGHIAREPYVLAVVFTDHLAVKNPGQSLTYTGITAGQRVPFSSAVVA